MPRPLLCVLGLFLFSSFNLAQQAGSMSKIDRLLKEIEKIQTTTNWMNPAAAENAKKKIERLTQEFTKLSGQPSGEGADNNTAGQKPSGYAQPGGGNADGGSGFQLTEDKMKGLIDKYVASQDEYVDTYFAEPVQKVIMEEYEEDASQVIKNPEVFQSTDQVVIDMSLPQAPILVDLLKNYKSVKRLIITASKGTPAVDLKKIIDYSRHLPLNEFYAVHLKGSVAALPDNITAFKGLEVLGLFDNNISKFPASVLKIAGIKKIYIDSNPITSVPDNVSSLKRLSELGIAGTKIGAGEAARLQKLLPNCKVLTQ